MLRASALKRVGLFCVMLLWHCVLLGAPETAGWTALLQRHVSVYQDGAASRVDYAGFQRDRAQLATYLDQLSAVSREAYDAWPEDEQLAFLINAYNAFTVELILTRYPDLKSIKDLGTWFKSPWQKEFIPLLGEQLSLDDIEHGMIRAEGVFEDPRIHFAVNCASIGCPALRNEAYTGSALNLQLEEQTRGFLSDHSRNGYQGDALRLSSIFDWYAQDFEGGRLGYTSLGTFLVKYASALRVPDDLVSALQRGELEIEYLSYDWRLNDTGGQ